MFFANLSTLIRKGRIHPRHQSEVDGALIIRRVQELLGTPLIQNQTYSATTCAESIDREDTHGD